jgi:hypothetical protein
VFRAEGAAAVTRTKKPTLKTFPLCVLVSATGYLEALEVFTVGGVTVGGDPIEPDPSKIAFPTLELAEAAAKELGPDAFATRAFITFDTKGRRLVRWSWTK